MTTPKNCPFCKPPTMIDVIRVMTLDDKLAYAVMCDECQARSPMVYLPESDGANFTIAREAAITAWNEMSEAVAHRKAVDDCGVATSVECVVVLERGWKEDGVYQIFITAVHGAVDINDVENGKVVEIERMREALSERLESLTEPSIIADVVLVKKCEQEDVFYNWWFEVASFKERGGQAETDDDEKKAGGKDA